VTKPDAELDAANARLAAASSRDVPCVTCGHSIMVHQNNEAGGPCGQCDCDDGKMPQAEVWVRYPKRSVATVFLTRRGGHRAGGHAYHYVLADVSTRAVKRIAEVEAERDNARKSMLEHHDFVARQCEKLGSALRESEERRKALAAEVAELTSQRAARSSIVWHRARGSQSEAPKRCRACGEPMSVPAAKQACRRGVLCSPLRDGEGGCLPMPDASERARGAWDAWTDEDRATERAAVAALADDRVGRALDDLAAERAACAAETERAAEAVARVKELEDIVVGLAAQVGRLTEQLSVSHTTARVAELVAECTRHETEARDARAEVRMAGHLLRGEQRRHDEEEQGQIEALRLLRGERDRAFAALRPFANVPASTSIVNAHRHLAETNLVEARRVVYGDRVRTRSLPSFDPTPSASSTPPRRDPTQGE